MPDLPERLTTADIKEWIIHNPGSVISHGYEYIIATPREMASYRLDGRGHANRTSYVTY